MLADDRVADVLKTSEGRVRGVVAPVSAFGLVLPGEAGQLILHARCPAGGSAQRMELPPDPAGLERATQFSPGESPSAFARCLGGSVALSPHDRLLVAPLPEPPGLFWVTVGDSDPADPEQLRRCGELGAAILQHAREPEAVDEVRQRLASLDRLAQQTWPHEPDATVDSLWQQTLATARDLVRCDQVTTQDSSTADGDALAALTGRVGLAPGVGRASALRYAVIDDVDSGAPPERGASVGFRSALVVPVCRPDGSLEAPLVLQAYAPGGFAGREIFLASRLAKRVADGLRFARIAEGAAQLKQRSDVVERLDKLLVPLATTGSVREVFDQLSSIAGEVVAHDALMLPIRTGDGSLARLYATTGFGAPVPETIPVPAHLIEHPDWDFDIESDIQAVPSQRHTIGAQRGYRSMLRLSVQLDGEFAGALVFLSRTPSLYSEEDLPLARRMTDRLTLAFSRERREEATRRADETDVRATRLENRVRDLAGELDARTGMRRVVGVSSQWQQVLTEATRVAETTSTVLILGESGTGKELVARFIHRASGRANGPFVAINCATLPDHLLEAELFGYERGAFTGAVQAKPGQIEQATGGTIFLDEVAEMSPVAQAKVLRVLQEREFQRLGGTRRLTTDARFLAATNRDLEAAMARGQFREDLYYRLNVFSIRLPALRDRVEDVMPLTEAFLEDLGRTFTRPPAGVSREARSTLLEYHWPGNVRELRNVLERAGILCDGGLITSDHLALRPTARPPVPAAAGGAGPPREEDRSINPSGSVSAVERSMIEQALREARFNKSRAAKALGLTRAQLYVRLRRYGLE